jgi:threonine/homoserine efflux transporter RhtA
LLAAWSHPRLRGRDVRAWLRIAALGLLMAAASLCLCQALARVPFGTAVTAASIGATIPLLDRVADESDGLDGLALSVLAAALVMLPIGLPAALGAGAVLLSQQPGLSQLAGIAIVIVAGATAVGTRPAP